MSFSLPETQSFPVVSSFLRTLTTAVRHVAGIIISANNIQYNARFAPHTLKDIPALSYAVDLHW